MRSRSYFPWQYSPTTVMSPWSETVSKAGASPDTSHRYLPELVRFTLFKTTELSVDSSLWMQIRDYKLLRPIERDARSLRDARRSERTKFYHIRTKGTSP